MTQYQTPPQQHQPQLQKPPKGWFARNWWWFLALVIGGPIFCCCGGGGLMTYMASQKINQMIEDNPAYKQAMTLLESNPEVAQELGTPITVPGAMELMSQGGGSKSVSVTSSGNSRTFDANIPVTGPNGSGTLVIVAEDATNNGTWTFKELYLELPSGERIELDTSSLPGGLQGNSGVGGSSSIGNTGATAELGEHLPRSISPNSATSIEPEKDDDPWTAFQGRQASILQGNTGSARTQFREVTAVPGTRLIYVTLDTNADGSLLQEARQHSASIAMRDQRGGFHGPIGFALLREDQSMNLSLRPRNTITADDLPRVDGADVLTIYFEAPVGVAVTEFVLGDPIGEAHPFSSPIRVTPKR
ncbi:cytochrome c oxidase assembly factor Coa1 family protein [Phycisphaeraceae bacterium D3-23]